ncbi:hypothetical protein [Spirosoma fluminis]
MKLKIAAWLLTVGISSCTSTDITSKEPLSSNLIIRTGTSFGMCVGYCFTDYELSGTTLTLTQTAPRTPTEYPTKTCQSTLTTENWQALQSLADFETFSKQPDTLGCPDCADGGAEYIELQRGDQKHRVTFEFNQTIPGFESLVNALRQQRESFKTCP